MMAQIGNHIIGGMTISPSLGTGSPQQQPGTQPQSQQVGQGVLEQPPTSTSPYNPFTGEHQ
jgi:hypothetical protein